MPQSFDDFRNEFEQTHQQLGQWLSEVLLSTDERAARSVNPEVLLSDLNDRLGDSGPGLRPAIERLIELQNTAGANTAGPRCYHFVIGGSTPAAMAADLLATAYESPPYTWVIAPAAVAMELQALDWLKELLELPESLTGVMVTGATMANFVGAAAGRQWWGEQHGVDVAEAGLAGLPQMPVLSSGHIHASMKKVLALQGIGRGNIQAFARDNTGRIDLPAMQNALNELDGAPALMVINAGEVNSGDFDPINDMIDLARQHNVWVHVDGAFGLFARLSPRTRHLVQGVERADSITVDGHKWLNVPYDSGYAFVRDKELLARAFRYSADYLPAEDDPRPTLGAISPESSRRARGLAVWATLKAYGRDGHRRIVEHCLDMAQRLATHVDEADDFERLAEVPLNIVAFRYNPGGISEKALNELNQRLGEATIEDGRFLLGTSRYGDKTIFRPAFSNWRTRPEDVDELLQVLREMGEGLIQD